MKKKKLNELTVGWYGFEPDEEKRFRKIFPQMEEINVFQDKEYEVILCSIPGRNIDVTGYLRKRKNSVIFADVGMFEGRTEFLESLGEKSMTIDAKRFFNSRNEEIPKYTMEYRLIQNGINIDESPMILKRIAWISWDTRKERGTR